MREGKIFEKMGEQPIISDEEIDDAGERELTDTTNRDSEWFDENIDKAGEEELVDITKRESEWQKEKYIDKNVNAERETQNWDGEDIFLDLITEIKDKYNKNFLDVLDKLNNEEKSKINDVFGVNLDQVLIFLKLNLDELFLKLNEVKDDPNIEIKTHNSLREIFVNMPAHGGLWLNKFLKKMMVK